MAQPSHLREQLRSFLPFSHHSIFSVRLDIHDLLNVPLVSGDFAIKYHVRNSHSVLSMSSNGRKPSDKAKGKAREVGSGDTGDYHDDTNASEPPSRAADSSGTTHPDPPLSIHNYGQFLTPEAPPRPPTRPSTPPTPLPDIKSSGKGYTPFVPIKDHNVHFDCRIDSAVQLTLNKDTHELMPSELKLTILQNVSQSERGTESKPHRLGALYINIAEYAGAGPVTRRFLLQESKVNATLKLTLDLAYIGGAKDFVAPPLQESQLAGLSSLINGRRLADDSRNTGDVPSFLHQRPTSARTNVRRGIGTRSQSQSHFQLPGALSQDTTENIIEAIFNPFPTTSTTPSPFSIYVPDRRNPKLTVNVVKSNTIRDAASVPLPSDSGDEGEGSDVDRMADDSSEASHSTSTSTMNSSKKSNRGGWWKRLTGSNVKLAEAKKPPTGLGLGRKHAEGGVSSTSLASALRLKVSAPV